MSAWRWLRKQLGDDTVEDHEALDREHPSDGGGVPPHYEKTSVLHR